MTEYRGNQNTIEETRDMTLSASVKPPGAQKQWMVRTKKADFQAVAKQYGIDPVTARILRNRDMTEDREIREYLFGTMEDLYDGALLPDMDAAVSFLLEDIEQGKHIRIVGDYDIDGVCASYILCRGLRALSAKADYVIPDRIKDGYGINVQIIDKAIEDGVDTIVTCDNGIAAVSELLHAKEAGLRVIVTDHHDVRLSENGEEELPPADAIVNAKRSVSRYPSKDICGAVTAWKLLKELLLRSGKPLSVWQELLEFAAIATVGDVMPLRGENRIIVREGLSAINGGCQNLGLRTLIEACGLSDKEIVCYHIGFVIGPCINAGGRLETAELALRLFLSETSSEAKTLSAKLKALNDERKEMTERGTAEAISQAWTKYREDKVLVIYLPKLHESLAGIVAGRLKEYFGKPALVITDAENGAKGSGRSIEAYHMFEGLCRVSEHLTKFGGHPMAAGFSLEKEEIDAFRKALNERAELTEADFVQKLWIDVPMPVSYVTAKLIQELKSLEPFGQGNEKPVFAEKGVRLSDLKVLGKNRNVLKMQIRERDGYSVPGIMFCDGDEMLKNLYGKGEVSILYYPQINEYNGTKSLQMVVTDVR